MRRSNNAVERPAGLPSLAAAAHRERSADMPLLFTPGKSGRDTMSVEENKALVRRLLERVRDGWSPAVIEEFFAPVTEDISIPQRHRLLPWVNKRERTDFGRPSPTLR